MLQLLQNVIKVVMFALFIREVYPAEVIAITGMGIDLNEKEREIYDNDQILRAPFRVSEDRQSFYLMASCPAGTGR